MKGYFPTPDIAYFVNPTSDIGARNWSTSDIPKSARNSTLYFQRASVYFLLGETVVSGLNFLYSNSTLKTLILKLTHDIAKNLNSTLDILSPLYGP